jgi:hypothetical protein
MATPRCRRPSSRLIQQATWSANTSDQHTHRPEGCSGNHRFAERSPSCCSGRPRTRGPRLRPAGGPVGSAALRPDCIERVRVGTGLAVRRTVSSPPAGRLASPFPSGWRSVRCGVIRSERTGGGVDCRLFGRDHCPVQRGRDYECAAAAREISHVGLTAGQLAEHRLRVVSEIPALVTDTDVRHRTTVSASSHQRPETPGNRHIRMPERSRAASGSRRVSVSDVTRQPGEPAPRRGPEPGRSPGASPDAPHHPWPGARGQRRWSRRPRQAGVEGRRG